MGMEFLFWGDENVLELVFMMVVQLSEYIKNHWIVYFKGCVSCFMNYISTKMKSNFQVCCCFLQTQPTPLYLLHPRIF